MSNWLSYTLEEVCERIYSGGTPSTNNYEYWGGTLKWLSSGETSQRFIYDTDKKITEEGVKKSSTKLASKGCTVIATAGQGFTRGQTSYLMTNTYINQSIIACKPNVNIINPLYLYYNLDNRYEEFRMLSDGTSTRGGLSGTIVKRMKINLPSLEEQGKIVSVLYIIDKKIEVNNQINENLLQQMITIFKNARNSSTWPKKKLEDILIFYDHMRKPLSFRQRDGMERNYPYYGATTIVDYVDNYIFNGIYILISEDGANVVDKNGHPLIQYTYGKFWVNNHAHVVRGSNGFSEALLFALLKTLNIQSIVTGAAQPKVNQANLRNFAVLLPNPDEAKHLSDNLNPFFNQMIENDKENALLTELRDTLLPKLMSGGLDVSDFDF